MKDESREDMQSLWSSPEKLLARLSGRQKNINDPVSLTGLSALFYLLTNTQGEKMKGTIRPISRQTKCPTCKKRFESIEKLGYGCPDCNTVPKRFFIDLHWRGKRVGIYSDKHGQPLDTYERTSTLYSHIQYEITHHIFDPSKYAAADLQRYLFENVIEDWLSEKERDAEKGNLSWSYIKPLRGYRKNYLEPFFRGQDVRDIRTVDVKKFYQQLSPKLSPKTQKNILDALQNFFNTLFVDEVIPRKPSIPKVSVPEPEVKWCTQKVQDEILNAIPEKQRPIFFFLSRQGLRPGEAIALKWQDIDLKNGIITVKRTVSDRKIVERTKTKTVRPRLIHPEIVDILQSIPRGLPHTYLFVNPNTGRPYSPDTLQKIWKQACTDVGVEISIYQATRHSVASMAATSGVSIQIIKEVLGHTDIRTTQKYAHLDVLAQSEVFTAQNENRRQTVDSPIFGKKKPLKIKGLRGRR